MHSRRITTFACVLALCVPAALGACGDEEPGIDEPAREGLVIDLEGVDYNVFITRQLNPRVPPDGAYVEEDAPPGQTLYGVFLQVCNQSDEDVITAEEFVMRDNQENTWEPEELPPENEFAYVPRTLAPEECIPELGSVAQLGPTAGSMLLFQLPLENTENRPMELEIGGQDGGKITFELDF